MNGYRTRRAGLKWAASIAIGLAVLALSASAQGGEKRAHIAETTSVYLVKYYVNGDVQYSKDPEENARVLTAEKYRRDNPYVCTPSGFGQKARCYAK